MMFFIQIKNQVKLIEKNLHNVLRFENVVVI